MSFLARHVTHIFLPAVLRENKDWYIEYSYQRQDGSLKRKRTYINCKLKRFRTKAEKRAFALNECALINERLSNGWTPEMDKAVDMTSKAGTLLESVYTEYQEWIEKSERNGNLRHETMLTYRSTKGILKEWTDKTGLKYIYQLDEESVSSWLTWAREDRKVSHETQKNYKRWLRNFFNWCIDFGYTKTNAATAVKLKDTAQQRRQDERKFKNKYIDTRTREKIFSWMAANDRHLLLASYLCYYCFIRPHEIMQLRIEDVHLKEGLIFIPHEVSKNDTDGWVTLPDIVASLMVDLGVFSKPSNWRIFNRQLVPGPLVKADRGDALRDRWSIMRKELGLPERVVMYNLKHTGITDMLGKVETPRAVQLQARHHSLEQTEEYVQTPTPEANKTIKSMR